MTGLRVVVEEDKLGKGWHNVYEVCTHSYMHEGMHTSIYTGAVDLCKLAVELDTDTI